jgi:hypothetical protein
MAKYIALFVLFIAMTNALHLQGDKFSIRIRGKDGLYLTSCGFCPEINVGTNLEPHIVTLHVFVGEKEKRAGS